MSVRPRLSSEFAWCNDLIINRLMGCSAFLLPLQATYSPHGLVEKPPVNTTFHEKILYFSFLNWQPWRGVAATVVSAARVGADHGF